ncbi:capsular biosynthesis protein [Qipengyuania marisflavi]|uniref:Capsular biosynthesis protein n=1 Tax=Qipengyuania marisflavi TaxID=2486356 RepID=A0A5S3PB87_9SPHN|nr:capsular biosynthesis protein [Qipengyuania marisflavi]TMM50025.1 capsular biosynthesis protein [Qipengyuania marisflavi]
MSVNKPTKITPPDDGEKTAKRGSLFERASGAFGLDRLAPAAVPDRLASDKAKKFAPRREAPLAPSEPQPVPQAAPVAAPVVTPPVDPVEPEQPAVRFNGDKQEIVRSLLREQGLIDPDGGASTLLEEFRIIKRQLLAAAKAENTPQSRRVLVCSPHSGEGKTFCALNLAMAMAGERDSEVLLIDADFGKPSILARLGLDAGKGFMDVLADPKTHVEDYVIGTDIPGLWVLPAGARTGRDSEYLASERTWEVLNRLTRGAPRRTLIFDSPPALAASPAAELAKHVGQALLVARADMTGRAALEDAVDLLSACPDIKLLLNDATFSPSGRRFGSYYGYGE